MGIHIHAAEERREAVAAPFDWPIGSIKRLFASLAAATFSSTCVMR